VKWHSTHNQGNTKSWCGNNRPTARRQQVATARHQQVAATTRQQHHIATTSYGLFDQQQFMMYDLLATATATAMQQQGNNTIWSI